MCHDELPARDTYVVALTPTAAKLLDADPAKFLANLEGRPEMDVGAIRAFVHDGPEIKLYVEGGRAAADAESAPFQHGLGLRLRIPYRKPELVDLRLNGHLLAQRATDGYHTWWADGYTQVQIDVPPEKATCNELLVVTCAYAPDVQRTYGWTPPPEVRERVRRKPPAE